MKIFVTGAQRSGTTLYYSNVYESLQDPLEWSTGNNLLAKLYYGRTSFQDLTKVKQVTDCVTKNHFNYILKFIDKYGPNPFKDFYEEFDETHLVVRKNTFELTLSQIMWKLSNQHGDANQEYNLDTYPSIYIPFDYYDLIHENLMKEIKQDQLMCEEFLNVDKIVYYEDLADSQYVSQSPDKSKYILNYQALKDNYYK